MSLINRKKRDRRTDRGSGYADHRPGYGSTGSRRSRRRRGFAGPIIIICALVAVLVAADYWLNSGNVHRGVEVGNVPLGGMEPAEARDVVRERALGPLQEIELSGPDRFSRSAEELGVNFHVDATVDKAYAVGREGNVLERLGERLQAAFPGITIDPNISYRSEKVRAEVEEIAGQTNTPPRDATLEVVGSEVEVGESREGYRLNVDGTMAGVDEAIDGMTGETRLRGEVLDPRITTAEAETAAEKARGAVAQQLVFEHEDKNWTVSPADVGASLDVAPDNGKISVSLNRDRMSDRLAAVYSDLTVKPKNASYDFNGNGDVVVIPGREGRNIEWEKLLDSVENNIFKGKREYQVKTNVENPKYTTAGLEAKKPTELLGSYKTNYTATTDQGAERVKNLKLASNAVNGTFVAPGETFSMVEKVQDLNYEEAHVIVENREEMAEGGGLCQVTSTLYNAILYSGIPVTERQPHNSVLPYIRPGMDATVWYGDKTTTADDVDMQFENTTDGYVLIQEYVSDDGYMYANVYGVPDNIEVEMSSKPVFQNQDAAKWTTSYTRYKNGKAVYEDSWESDYDALYNEKGKKIPTKKVPKAEVDGSYNGFDFSSAQ
ncbi:MAG: Vancomycin B-type resistance protein VanW [uncultured Rubrobacteraceae bacterium]|uniref:Vancomycin B-type resistance protein VanW n=1 Tax=uncultured Rubrobacteraceae bacterium TaxID=349277 RepID=A0A6J4NS33_9ACTN|nr:MAG: Vancomycin B-type resistance protein VanW [uncultured Rubrobacteraceae bacterium]